MEIDIEKLRSITNLIFDHIIEDVKIKQIELRKDYYWDIDTEQLYNMKNDPTELGVGQLYDDWEFLTKIENRDEAVAYMLTHLAPLLRYIGEEIGQ
jgi:hypothetical protein